MTNHLLFNQFQMLQKTPFATPSAPCALGSFLLVLCEIVAIGLLLSASQDLQAQDQAKDSSPSLDCRYWDPGSQEKVGLPPRTSAFMWVLSPAQALSLHQASVFLFSHHMMSLIFQKFLASSFHWYPWTLWLSWLLLLYQDPGKMQTDQGPQESAPFFKGLLIAPSNLHSFLHKYRVWQSNVFASLYWTSPHPVVMQLKRRLPLGLLPTTSCLSYFSIAVIKHDQNNSRNKMFNWARGFGELESTMAEQRHGDKLRTHNLTYKEKAERARGTTRVFWNLRACPSDSRANLPILFKLVYPLETKHSNMNLWEAILIQTTMLPKPRDFPRVQLDGTGPGGQPVPGPLPH